MTTSPSLDLQGAIVARLKDYVAVTALVGQRVYDSVPSEQKRTEDTGKAFPYISMGPRDEISDNADCAAGFDISMQIDVWSRSVGYPEAERIADAIRTSLRDYDFPPTDNPIVFFEHRQTRVFRDPDGLTTHAALTFEAFAEQP